MAAKLRHSPIRQATTMSTPLKVASGMNRASGAASQDDGEQGERVHHPGHRGAPAGADIGRGARDGSRRGDPAEPWTNKVCQPLPDQFLIGIVPACDHPIGHHGREERLDRAHIAIVKAGRINAWM